MSVVRCTLMSTAAKVTRDKNYNRVFTHAYIIETSSPDDGPLVVETQMELVGPTPVPAMWAPYNILTGTYPAAGDVFLQSREVVRLVDDETDKTKWKATCSWSTPEPGQALTPPAVNPLDDPIKYSLEWSTFTKLVDVDINGHPIVNGAGDEFDPPVQRDDYRPVLVAIRNMWPLQAVIDLALRFKNAVNNDVFYGAPAGRAKVESISSGPIQQRNEFNFYAVSIRVQFNGVGTGTATGTGDPSVDWLVRLVNRGRHFIGPDGDKKVPFQSELKDGASPGSTDPEDYQDVVPKVPLEYVNLTSTGQRKYPDYAPAEFTGTAFQIYPAVPFTGPFGLGI